MASVDKHEVLKVPTDSTSDITLLLDNKDWYSTITRLWGEDKEVKRYIFNIKGEYNKFECDEKTGEKIVQAIGDNTNGSKEITISLSSLQIVDRTKYRKLSNMWSRFKKIFGVRR